ncbi:MAG TPA: S24 family peptidase, partial [Acidimicrobiales bacterium]
LDGDYVVVRQQPEVERGDIIAAGLPDGDATVKFYSRRGRKVVLKPANQDYDPIEHDATEVAVYGKVVTVLRRL